MALPCTKDTKHPIQLDLGIGVQRQVKFIECNHKPLVRQCVPNLGCDLGKGRWTLDELFEASAVSISVELVDDECRADDRAVLDCNLQMERSGHGVDIGALIGVFCLIEYALGVITKVGSWVVYEHLGFSAGDFARGHFPFDHFQNLAYRL